MPALRLGVLVSGSGTNLQSIIDATRSGALDAEVAVVVSNKRKALGLERARDAGIAAEHVSHRGYETREAFEEALIAVLARHGVQWVALAGFMRVLTSRFLSAFPGRVVNIHPALLPAFPGVEAQRQAWEYGVKVAGCTIHFVDEGTDTGPIIAQAAVPVLDDDDVHALQQRILAEEHRLYPQVLQWIAQGRLRREGRRVLLLPSADRR